MPSPAPAHVLDVSPPGRSITGGSSDEPADEEAVATVPIEGVLSSLTVDAGGEVGVRIEVDGERVFPAESDAPGGYLFMQNWPPETFLGRMVRAGDEVLTEWRRIEAGEVAVRAFVTVLQRGAGR